MGHNLYKLAAQPSSVRRAKSGPPVVPREEAPSLAGEGAYIRLGDRIASVAGIAGRRVVEVRSVKGMPDMNDCLRDMWMVYARAHADLCLRSSNQDDHSPMSGNGTTATSDRFTRARSRSRGATTTMPTILDKAS